MKLDSAITLGKTGDRPEASIGAISRGEMSALGHPPVIGLTTYLEQATQGVWNVRAAFLQQKYIEAVSASGGVAVLLPPQPHGQPAIDAVLARIDGLILTGGADVQPELYGAERHPLTDPARRDRDTWELALLAGAEACGVPVLAICRGLQLANVRRGGTLHQDLPEKFNTGRYRKGPGEFARNTVTVEAGTTLSKLVGEGDLKVHSYHHQAVDSLGEGLRVSARDDLGLVQAFESTAGSYLLGVQWHPEENGEDRRLFAGLVDRASAFAASRTKEAHTA